ncbi:hypothetical protein SAMN04488074_12880 [Lentzea albidocapillata subsp. violacea]|uniref:Uncharacterized protein n=1 Tax=Lentzea albidocapillata subsp. violacea TaxID=128104 RepID=A0A1G9WUB9_9PSEU|nr:hypothetical protein SAMN04488074_12880 [Lentzea albidocapillata subsp. violacea]
MVTGPPRAVAAVAVSLRFLGVIRPCRATCQWAGGNERGPDTGELDQLTS